MRMVGNRPAPFEFSCARPIAEQAPMPANRSLQIALPGLIERFNDVDSKIFALASPQRVVKYARLISRRWQRAGPHPTGTWPADLADQNLLSTKRCRHLFAD